MPVTVFHSLSATTPDDPSYEIRPSHWNSQHVASISAVGTEIIGAFSNDPAVNISFSTNAGGYVIASANVTAAPSPVNVTGANGSSVAAQTIAFSNANGMSLGVSTAANGATITGSYTVPTQTNQTIASGGIAGTGFTSTTTAGVSVVGTLNTAGLSVAIPNYITTWNQTNQTVASGNIAGTGFTSTTTAGTAVVATNNTAGLSMAVPLYLTTFNQTNQTVASGNIAGTGFTSTTTAGTAIVATNNTAGLSMAVPLYLTTYAAQTVQTQASGAIAGSGFTGAGANISLSGTLNSQGLSLSASVAAGGGGGFTGGVSNIGNTLGNTGTQTGQVIFAGGNNITLSVSTAAGGAQTITISGANAGGAQTGISGIQVSNTTYTSGTVTFQNANGISFGSSGAGGISASYTVPTQTVQPVAVSGSNGSFAFSTVTFGNLNGASFYTSNGSVVASYTVPTVPASYVSQVNGSSGALSFATGSSLSSSSNGSTITWGLASNITTALQSAGAYLTTAAQSSASNVSVVFAATNNTGGGTATLSGGVSFSNANSVTFYTSAGNAVVASVSFPGDINQGISNVGNTAGNTGTASTGVMVFAGSNMITASQSTAAGQSTLWFNATQSVQTQASGNIVGSGFTTTTTAGSVMVGTQNSAGLSLGVPNWLTVAAGGAFSAGASTDALGTTGLVNAQLVFFEGANVSLSQSINGQSASLTISAAAGGAGGGNTLSYWTNNPMTSTVSQTLGNSTSYLFPVFLPDAVSASYIRFPVSMGVTSTSYQTTGNTAWSASRFSTWNVHLYSMMTGASSQSLGYVTSGSAGFTEARTVSAAANSTQFSVGFSMSYPITGGTSSYATSYGESSNSLNLSSQSYTLFTGERFLDIPLANSLSAGMYYMLYGVSSATSTSGANSLSALNVSQSFMVATQVNNAAQLMGQVSASSVGHFLGLGSVSIAAGATTSSIALSQVSSSASQPIPYIQFIRQV